MSIGLLVGIVFVVGGITLVIGALPITHHLARMLPQWSLSRGDVDRLGSTTFLTSTIGLLMTITGVVLIVGEFIVE